MDKIFIYVIYAALFVPLIVGFLLGLMRGFRRSTLRILLVILCLVAAICLKGVVTDKVMVMNVKGQPLNELLLNQLPENYKSMGDSVLPIISLFIAAVVFLLLFLGAEFVSWLIIYPICKIFVKKARKKKDGTYGSRHRLIGSVIGLVQGAVVAVVLCVVLNGLFSNVSAVMSSVDELNQSSQSGGTTNAALYADENGDVILPSEENSNGGSTSQTGSVDDNPILKGLKEYGGSKICNILSKSGGDKIFDGIASIKKDGKTLTLSGQIDGLNALVKMANQLVKLQDLATKDFSSSSAGIVDMFNELDNITKDLSDESKETVNTIVQAAADTFLPEGMNVDVGSLNLANVDFKNEGQIIEQLSTYKDINFNDMPADEFEAEAKNIVDLVTDSDIILPVISQNQDFKLGLEGENLEYVENYVGQLEQEAQGNEDKLEKIEMLKTFFGLTSNGGTSETPAQ